MLQISLEIPPDVFQGILIQYILRDIIQRFDWFLLSIILAMDVGNLLKLPQESRSSFSTLKKNIWITEKFHRKVV